MPTYIVVDVESDGPIIGLHSMICFGAVVLDHKGLKETFYGECCPANMSSYDQDALSVSGFTREETLRFPDRKKTMKEFAE